MSSKLLPVLHWIINILEEHEIQYSISGGFAAHLYGSPRPINDIDLDIPEDDFDKIYGEVKDFIIFGPANYKDARWDLKLMTLNYHGQEIDISGAFEQKIHDDNQQKWLHDPTDFTDLNTIPFDGLDLKVITPENLLAYKKLLIGDHQAIDIKAVEKFISQKLEPR